MESNKSVCIFTGAARGLVSAIEIALTDRGARVGGTGKQLSNSL